MLVNIPQLGAAQLYAYRYDQLNRIKAMNTYSGVSATTNTLINPAAALPDYNERITYDPNGNIITYKRNGTTQGGNNLAMDDLGYAYYPGTNQLKHVSDNVTYSGNYTDDIDNQSIANNYTYDAIGNLTADNAEGIIPSGSTPGIEWNVYGKISAIHKGSTTISYSYDASGNRISKTVGNKTTWYVRDASGNVMGIYEKGGQNNSGHLTLTELHMYGSSRLGIYNTTTDVEFGVTNEITNFERGDKFFELANHLGNVLVTVSDKKIAHNNGSGQIDYYNADIITANAYYPGGMQMPGRKYMATSSSNYRYSINGQEKEKELNENITTALYWEYDSRIVRRWNLDPKQNFWESPYSCFNNNSIRYSDPYGLKGTDNIYKFKDGTTKVQHTKDKFDHIIHVLSGDVKIAPSKDGEDGVEMIGDYRDKFDSKKDVVYHKNNSEQKGTAVVPNTKSPAQTNINTKQLPSNTPATQPEQTTATTKGPEKKQSEAITLKRESS